MPFPFGGCFRLSPTTLLQGQVPGASCHVPHGIPPGLAACHVLLDVPAHSPNGHNPKQGISFLQKAPQRILLAVVHVRAPQHEPHLYRAQTIVGKWGRQHRGRNNCRYLRHVTTSPWDGMEVFLCHLHGRLNRHDTDHLKK